MILVRQVFQVKYGCMDKVLALFKSMPEDMRKVNNVTRVLTDISGQNFTLVTETKAESLNAYWESLQAMFKQVEGQQQFSPLEQYIESGHKEFYTIEYETAG
jgi:hypothetical protein